MIVEALFLLAQSEIGGVPVKPDPVDVFVAKEDGVFEYRIPALAVSNQGTLIAVCDGRMRRRGDLPNDINLVMKKSRDLGASWGPLTTIRDYPDWEGAGDPALLCDTDTGHLWCAYDYGVPASAKDRKRWLALQLMVSEDEGETWSDPVDLTVRLKPAGFDYLVVGPGAGTQLRDGTLVFPTYMRREDGELLSQLVYSRDHGKTWLLGPNTGVGTGEPTLVEREDGSLLMNMRTIKRVGHRLQCVSEGLDQPWSPVRGIPELIAPGCMASFARWTGPGEGDGQNRVLFCNPAHETERRNLLVRLSYDEGETWPVAKTIEKGPVSYSCLAVLKDKTVGLLYEGEHNRKDGVKRIRFVRFDLSWLTDGADSL